MKQLILAAAALATFSLVSCSPSKEKLKEKFVKTCEESADKQLPDPKMKSIFQDYCECSGDKVVNKYSASEIEAFDKMSQQEMQTKLMPVIQPCLDDLQNKVMKQQMGAAGQSAPATNP